MPMPPSRAWPPAISPSAARIRLVRAAKALATLGLIAWIYQIIHSGGLYAVYGRPYGWFGAHGGYLGEAFQFGLPGALLLLLARSGLRLRRSDLVWIALGLLPLLGHGLLGARRGPTFMALVGVGVMWYLVQARRPRLGATLLGGLAVGLLLLFLLANRNHIHLGAQPDFTGAGEAATFAIGPGNEFVFGAGAALNAETLDRFGWGRRYFVVFVIRPIPRALWPTKYADAARFLGHPEHRSRREGPAAHRFRQHHGLGWRGRLGARRHLRPLAGILVGLSRRRLRRRVGLWPRLAQGLVARRLLAGAVRADDRALDLLRHAEPGCLCGSSAAARRRHVARLALRRRRRRAYAGGWHLPAAAAGREPFRTRFGASAMSVSPGVAVLFHRIGPYHLARLEAAGARCGLTAVELSAMDATYAWSRVDGAPNFTRLTLFEEDVDCRRRIDLRRSVHAALTAADPQVVVIPGWSHPGALSALLWCLQKGRPAVLMSESGPHDDVRRRAREATKRHVVRLFSSAVVGGAPHGAYACALGLSAGAVFSGYDVVDNQHFERGARQARVCDQRFRQRLGLPQRYFLASGRFVAKKNLLRLLDAYAGYRQRAGADAWHLVLLGDGELRAEVERRIARLDLTDVILAGFQQYDELPAYYGLAGAFVHASTTEQWGLVVNEAMAAGLPVLVSERCGCAPDLVDSGVNGFTFDPYDVEGLAGLMAARRRHDRRAAPGDGLGQPPDHRQLGAGAVCRRPDAGGRGGAAPAAASPVVVRPGAPVGARAPAAVKIGLLTAHASRRAAGVWVSVAQLGKALAERGLDVEIFGIADALERDGLRRMGRPAAAPARCVRQRGVRLRATPGRSLHRRRPSLLHANGLWMYPSLASWRWSRRAGRPYLVAPHGMLDPWAVSHAAWKKRLVGWWFENAHLAGAACLHALTAGGGACDQGLRFVQSDLRRPQRGPSAAGGNTGQTGLGGGVGEGSEDPPVPGPLASQEGSGATCSRPGRRSRRARARATGCS